MKSLLACLTVLVGMATPLLYGQTSTVVAFFAANRTDASLDAQMPVFEDMVTARLAGEGFEVISREIVIDAVGGLLQGSPENALDAALDDQTSALRLSQNLGADYLLTVSFIGFDTETRDVNAYNVSYTNEIYTLRASYRIIDGTNGRAIASGIAAPQRSIQQSAQSQTRTNGLVRELLDKASVELADQMRMKKATGSIRSVAEADAKVDFSVSVTLNDVKFPLVTINDDGQPVLGSTDTQVEALAVTVELDGFAIGTTGSGNEPATFSLSPGLHRIRLARADLVPYERMINIVDGMNLEIAMQLNAEGLNRWRTNTAMLDNMQRNAVLTDATAEQIRGLAQMLRQSGYKIDIKGDYKSDIRVDTDEGLTIEKNQNMMQQD
jgi:hypothetical protein